MLQVLRPFNGRDDDRHAPSVSWQQSSGRSGAAIHREFW